MFKTLANAWRVKEVRAKIIFTLLMLLIYRIGNFIPLPFVNKEALSSFFQGGDSSLLGFLDMMAGGALSKLSIFATNIYPYINASIIIQLLTIAIPRLEELAKEGETGRKMIGKYTRYLTIVLALIQAVGTVFGFLRGAIDAGVWQRILMVLCLVAGTQFLVFLGDMITEKGVGNGISLLIFLGIISRLPKATTEYFNLTRQGQYSIINVAVMLIAMIAIVTFVVAIQEGERRIPVQYAKRVVGRKMYGGQNTHIPIKVNMAGVMPVIFSTSLLGAFQTLAMLTGGGFQRFMEKYFSYNSWIYAILNILLIIFFTFFYNEIQFNPIEYSKNLQQNGGFIPGIRPGRPTSDYLGRIVRRIGMVGAVALAILATLPIVLGSLLHIQTNFTGTGIIIVVGVVIETVKQIEADMMMRHYKGFLS